MRVPVLLLLSMFLIPACDDKKAADPIAAPSASAVTAAVTPSAAPSASASAQPAASASAVAAPSGKPMFGCKTKVGDVKLDVQVFDAAKGSPIAIVKVDTKPAARVFTATTAPHAATYTLMFSGYGEGDKHPASEPALVAGDTILGRLVANGDKMEFYADKGFPVHPPKDGPYICEK